MKSIKFWFLLAMITFSLLSCGNKKMTLTINNTSAIDRVDEAITFSRKKVEENIGKIGKNQSIAVFKDDKQIPAQVDDMDGDGKWDELFFLVDIAANTAATYYLKCIKKEEVQTFEKRTNLLFANFAPPQKALTYAKRLSSTATTISQNLFQLEGPTWENDKVGFRNYFDARNGIDIFGKQVTTMALDTVGVNGRNYHVLADWGMDILTVSTSLGAGAIAMEIQDSVYRINYSKESNYQFVTEGPLRSVFDLNFPAWEAKGQKYDIKHRISIQAGQRYYESKVSISNLQKDEKLVVGLVRIQNDTLYQQENAGDYTYLVTYDKQSCDKEYLGMGVLVKTNDLNHTATAPEEGEGIIKSHLVALNAKSDLTTTYRFYACWELENKKFADQDYFINFMKKEAEMAAAPLLVKVK